MKKCILDKKNKTIKHGRAFTLAEVLITIGIIGVIAAMTIPSLINKTRKLELQSQLKKSYSTLLNATNQLKADNGISNIFIEYPKTAEARVMFLADLKPYLKAKSCTNQECGQTTTLSGYLTLNNNPYYLLGNLTTSLILDDGAVLRLSTVTTNRIYIDVNGYYKKPNKAGYDIFSFEIMPDGKIMPAYSTCSYSSADQYNGDGCTMYALLNKSPTGSGDYWNDFLED